MVALLKSQHASVVRELESQGVLFNEVDRAAFEKETIKLYSELPGVNMKMYDQIQLELKKIRGRSK